MNVPEQTIRTMIHSRLGSRQYADEAGWKKANVVGDGDGFRGASGGTWLEVTSGVKMGESVTDNAGSATIEHQKAEDVSEGSCEITTSFVHMHYITLAEDIL